MRSSDADSMRVVLCNDGNGGVEKYNTRVVGRPAASLSILSHKMICKIARCPSACQGATPRVGGPRAQGAFGSDFCIPTAWVLDVPRIKGRLTGRSRHQPSPSSQSTWADWAVVCHRLRSMVLSPSPIARSLMTAITCNKLLIISLVIRTHFRLNTSYRSWQTVSFLPIVTVATILNPREHALSDLCLISTSINCPQYCLGSFFRKHWTPACNCSCEISLIVFN
jgi:hypothetical protein